ncbi:MAG TPA: hypothetical protein VMW35_20265 [Myxococcota bacterium]|jgi:hypothetical protein|nr:hypothetical protein [Myxococcota bacterium]
MSIAWTWGTTEDERAQPFPGDGPGVPPDDPRLDEYYRGVTVRAPAPVVFRWLCQLRVAPYSYDWIDNGGRRSPRTLTKGLDRLEHGQMFLGIFVLEDFVPGVHLTLSTPVDSLAERLFGTVRITYWARPLDAGRTRLLVKLRVAHGRGPWSRFVRAWLPWGDLVMMRKQLLTLRDLAEATVPGVI